MRASPINLAILLFVGLAVVSGLAAFATGSPIAALPVVLHGLAGSALVVLAPWKAIAARRGLRDRADGRPWVVSVVLVAAAVLALGSGFLQTSGSVPRIGPLTTMQVHVGSGLVTLALTLVHLRGRPVRIGVEGRRDFLRFGGVLAGAAVAWAGFEGVLRVFDLPGGERRATGSHERGSFDPAALPATVWLNDRPPLPFDRVTFKAAGREWEHTVGDLDRGEGMTATLDCTTGWFSTQEWEGTLLAHVIPNDREGSILITSATGYRRRFPLDDAGRLLLATRLGGEPLDTGHGAPIRLVAPGRRGFWWVKWVVSVEVDNRPHWLQLPFPPT